MPSAPRDSPQDPQGPSRARRIRWLIYGPLGCLLAGGFLLNLAIRSEVLREDLRERIAVAAARALGRPVAIGAVNVTLLPPGFTVDGVRAESPLFGAGRVEGAFKLGALLRGRLVVTDLDIHEPVLDWDIDSGDLLSPSTPPSDEPGRVTLQRLRVRDGVVIVGSTRRRIDAELRGVQIQADNTAGAGVKGPWLGSIAFDDGRLSFDDLELAGVAGSLALEADPSRARVHRLTLRSRGVLVRASGLVEPGSRVRGEPTKGRFDVAATLDPASPALTRPLPQISAKEISLDLLLHLPGEGLSLAGSFTLAEPAFDADRDGAADGPWRPWTGERAAGTIEVTAERTTVLGKVERIAGGTIDVQYEGSADGTRSLALRIAGPLDLARTLEPVPMPGEPGVLPSSALSGNATLRWSTGAFEARTGVAELSLDERPGELPLGGVLVLAFDGPRIEVRSSDLHFPGGELSLLGSLDASGGRQAVALSGRLKAGEITPLAVFVERRFPGKKGSSPRPTDLSGAIEISGRIEGTLDAPRVAASFSTDGARLRLPVRGDPAGAALPLDIRAARGEVDVKPDRVALTVARLEAEGLALTGSAVVDPRRGGLETATVDVAEAPAPLLLKLMGMDLGEASPEGTVRLKADLADEGAGLAGPFEISADPIAFGAIPASGLEAKGRLEPGWLELTHGALSLFGGTVRASGRYPLSPGGTGGIDLTLTGLDLAEVTKEFSGPSLSGTVAARGRLEPGDPPRLDLELTGEAVQGVEIAVGRVTGSLRGPLDALRLELADEGGILKAIADVAPGVGDEAGTRILDSTVVVRRFQLQRLLPFFPPGALAGLRGEADGEVRIRGPIGQPRDIHLMARVDRLELAAGGRSLSARDPLRITVQDGFLTLAPAHLVGEGTSLSLGGSMVIGGEHEVTAIIKGQFDLGLAEVVFPELRAAGEGFADLRVIQREDRITYEGSLTAKKGTLAHPALPLPLLQLEGGARFDEEGILRLEPTAFVIGGGTVSASGWARFEGASMPGLHLALAGEGIRAELLPDLRAYFDAETSLDREGQDFQFSGRIQVLRAVYTRPFGVEASDLLLRSREFAPAAIQRQGAPVVRLDLKIDADGDLWVRNEDALIEAAAHLALAGSLARPELSGRISALEGGAYRFRDITYRIVGGSMDFADLTKIDPILEIEASTRVGSYEVTLRMSGRFSRPIYELTSEPPLPQRDIVWLLMTGQTFSETGNETDRAQAEGQVAAYLAAPVAGAVASPLEKALGVSSLRIDPFFLNGAADPTARVTVTKRVASDLLLTYSSSLGEGGQEIYQIEYNPGRLWDLIGTRDVDGSIGADVRIRRRWRGLLRRGQSEPALPLSTSGWTSPSGVVAKHRLGEVSVTADTWVDEAGALVRKLHLDPGDPYRRADLLEAREELRLRWVAGGYPAAQVEVKEREREALQGNGLPIKDVAFDVVAGPRHELVIEGDVSHRIARRAVRQAWQEPVLVEDLSETGRRALLDRLRRMGHYAAQVTAVVAEPSEGLRRITLTAEPGPKVLVREIRLSGNEHIAAERIHRQMLTRVDDWIPLSKRGLLKEPVLKDDVGAIRALYLASGFLSVRVHEPEVTLSGDGSEAILYVTIDEGEQSKVGDVVIEGSAEGVPQESLLAAAALPIGLPVSQESVTAAADRVRETLDTAGYSRARVEWRLEGRPPATRVVFNLLPLERARIRTVHFEGNTRTRGRIVDREVTLKEGDWFSRNGVLATQRNLYQLGVFRSVEVEAIPTPDQPGFVDVWIRVQEGSPILTAWGFGYDTTDRARATFELANNNLFGTRRGAALFLRGSTVDRRAQVTLRDPNLFGEKIETLLSGFIESQELESFDQRRVGSSLQLTRPLSKKQTLYGRYRLEDVDLSDLKISEEEAGAETVRLASAALSFSHDSRDDIINPTKGWFSSIDAGVYARALGSEEQFSRFYLSARRFTSLGASGIVWAGAIRAGALTSRDIPVSERFFAGGDTTLRGFSYNEVGPADPVTGNPVGGEGLFLLNQELRFPILGALKGVVFYDAGNVFEDLSQYDVTDLRHVGGLGLRFDTPVGPFRIEYGRKLDHTLDYDALGNPIGRLKESHGEFFLSIGQAF